MFTEPGVEVEFNSSLTVFTSCKLRVMTVGGGGHGGSFGGGGSGYIQYLSQNLTHVPPTTLIKLAVGDKGEASNVTINGNKVMALPGEDGFGIGGDGYSGGGGGMDIRCNGGFNGGDGECRTGGEGTEENISNYYFENYKLSFGIEGEYYYSEHDGAYAGGGGGGVLINGEGPGKRVNKVGLKRGKRVIENKAGVKEYRGEGFGGGGNYHEDNDNDGHSGVIIIEIVKD